jgi:MFS family permease
MARLPRTVVLLGLASLLTDLSSNMIFPLLPAFVAVTLGAGALGLGAMEGAAETTAAFVKLASGRLADRRRLRRPLVLAGYGLSGGVRPLLAYALTWPVVIGLRLLDRVGKGIRSAPRDALIADVTEPALRGRAFGLQRAMDNAGAMIGPLLAAALLSVGVSTRGVFLAAALPAAIVMLVLAFGLRESPRAAAALAPDAINRAQLAALGPRFRRLLAVVFVFALANSTDAFLLLRLGELGLGAEGIALVWTAHSVVRTAVVYLGGRIADRVERRRLLVWGWSFYVAIYAGFALARSLAAVIALLVIYALHYGAVEAAERALVADLAPSTRRGAAFGWYHAVVGFAALPASVGFGLLWMSFGAQAAFASGALLAALAVSGLVWLVPRAAAQPSER